MDEGGVGTAVGSGCMKLISYHHLPNRGNALFPGGVPLSCARPSPLIGLQSMRITAEKIMQPDESIHDL
jgi:hypothetical protein